MDRSKGRGGKSSKSHFLGSGELIALGKTTQGSSLSGDARKPSSSSVSSTKSLSSGSSSSKLFGGSGVSSSSSSSSKPSHGSASSSSSSSIRKRDGLPSQHEPSSKKSRLLSASTPSSSSTTSSSSKSSSKSAPSKRSSLDSLNVKSEDLLPDVFFGELEKAEKHKDTDRGQNLILAAIKKLRANRDKPDLRLCEALMLASKSFSQFFLSSTVVDALSTLTTVRKSAIDASGSKLKLAQQNASVLAPMAVNVLANAHSKQSSWPNSIAQLWVEDATGERFWVDTVHCKAVVDNIIYSFGTVTPNTSLLPPNDGPGTQLPSGGSSPSLGHSDDSSIQVEATQILHDQKSELSTANRFIGKETAIETIITEHVNDVITKKAPDIPRNVIRALSQSCGLVGVRTFVVNRLEQWLHNPKCGRHAQELLLNLCVNANCNTVADAEILTQITKLRMKTKPLMMFHAISVREMVRETEVNLRHVLNQVIYNELSPQRHANNLGILGSIISGCPESRSVLASIFLDLLTKREDFHPALRLLLREILRNCRFECDLTKFLKGLISRKNAELTWPTEVRERAFLAIVDLIMLSMFLSVSPQVREASMVRGDSKDQTTLTNFRKLISTMQNEAVYWLFQEVPKTFVPAKSVFMIALNKIIFKDAANDLVSKDGWPPDSEKTLFGRLVLDVPISENVIMWLSLMGLHKDYPILPREVFDFIELLIIRAATHRTVLKFSKPEMYELLFRLSEYKHPDEIVLPEGYEPPKLAISKLYWQAWLILCILAAHNPSAFGKLGWEQYPTLRMLMEMCMTNHFQFPTAAATDCVEDLMGKEIQTAAMEKQEILEFETHLAAASSKQTINERNSLLLSQLMRLDPLGQPRNPPQQFLVQLQHLNVDLHLGHLLCRSRNPDFLLDLIQKNSQPMPWLSQLVSEGSFDMLPIQCLCEFLLGQTDKLIKSKISDKCEEQAPEKSPRKHGKTSAQPAETPKDTKTLQLLYHLQNVVHNSSEPSDAREVIEYFLRRLASPKVQSRSQAVNGLQLLFANPGKVELVENWLMDCLPSLPIYTEVQTQVVVLLRQALQMETEPQLIFKYIEFLNVWGSVIETEGNALVLDVALLVVERTILTPVMLGNDITAYESFFTIFLNYMKKVREPLKSEYQWFDSEDMVLVRWSQERLEGTMDVRIIQALVLLFLMYASMRAKEKEKGIVPVKGNDAQVEMKFNELLDIWFPPSKGNTPKGYLLNTTEEAVLFPPWLRLKMAMSSHPRLLQAALDDLNVEQLLIFFQTFGLPHSSVKALLFCLDKATNLHREEVLDQIKNPQFMKSLIDLHWRKGASGGKKFYELLQLKVSCGFESSVARTKFARPQLNIPSMKEQSRNYIKLKASMQHSGNQIVQSTRNGGSRSSAGSILSYESEVCDAETSRIKIANLSKQLFALSSPPSSKRRSSVPVDPNMPLSLDDSMTGIRRHSSHCDSVVGSASQVPMEVDVSTSTNNLGELVDSITYIEPCIVRHCMDYQLPLLFGRNEIHPNCRSFLMTVLTHQAGWETVENLLSLFLKEFDSSYDPAAILDLISATNSNPKLWQGVDKYIPRHQPNVSPFKLSKLQLLTMAEYIVEEISQLKMQSTGFSINNLLDIATPPNMSKAVKNGLQDRVKLWLQCCQQDKNIVDNVISNLMEKKGKNPCAKGMVAQVYLEFPEIIFVEKWSTKAQEMNFTSEEITCVLDTVSHFLITAIANTQPGKDWSKKASHEIEICLRKLAAVHPTLLLRQLPLMGTLLEGRVHLEFSAFHHQNHHIPFVVFLGLLDLMQPYVLKHFPELKSSFTLYFKLFQNYGHAKDYSSSLSRFSVLLHNFLSANPKDVKEYLSPYYNTLRELSSVKYYIDVYPLQNLLSFLVPPNMVSELSAATPSAQVKNIHVDAHTAGFVSTLADRFLQASNHDETLPILQDLEGFSNRNPGVLYNFSEYLSPLLRSESDCCRNLAFSLIIKHVTYCPGECNFYLESIIQALESRNSHVRDTVLERIHEFIVLCQENGEEILMKIFDLGVCANINILPALKKSLSLLRNYSGVT